jgi:hypothetical protein
MSLVIGFTSGFTSSAAKAVAATMVRTTAANRLVYVFMRFLLLNVRALRNSKCNYYTKYAFKHFKTTV